MKIKLFVVALLASAFAFAPMAKADSITLESHTGDTYNYELTFNEHSATFFLDGFQITGLTGVTDATLSGSLARDFGIAGFDSTSVTVGTLYSQEYGKKIPFSVGTLTITSSAAPGDVDFAILDSNGLSKGQVEGPTDGSGCGSDPSPVPEPSSIVLLGSGMLAAAGVVRRKFSV